MAVFIDKIITIFPASLAIINDTADKNTNVLAVINDTAATSENLNYVIGGLIIIIMVLVGNTLFNRK